MLDAAPPDQDLVKILERLSVVGRRISGTARSVLVQAETNKGTTYNGSVGVTTRDGRYMYLPVLTENFNLDPEEAVRYTASSGLDALRSLYRERIHRQNDLDYGLFGKPVVTSGVTHALHMAGRLFLDPGDTLIVHDPYWENYDLMFGELTGAHISTYPLVDSQERFNVSGLRAAMEAAPAGSAVLINFPNNPTGFAPDRAAMAEIVEILHETSAAGSQLTPVIIDEAGYGYFFEPDVCRESLFSLLLKRHSEWLFPILAKGSTKEDLSYGARIGCLTFGTRPSWSEVLEAKVAALVRGEISTVATPSQLAVAKALAADPVRRQAEFERVYETLYERFVLIKHTILPALARRGFTEHFYVYPFNSGFFLTLQTKVDAYVLQEHLRRADVGVTVLDEQRIRVGFASVDAHLLEEMFEILLDTAAALQPPAGV